MTTIRFRLLPLILAASLFTLNTASAHEGHDHDAKTEKAVAGTLVPAKEKDAAWLAKARADYPLNACTVSGDKFDGGDMGTPMDYVYRQEGKPDRLVRFCCKDCLKDFNKDPAKYLKMIDEAAAGKAKDAAKH